MNIRAWRENLFTPASGVPLGLFRIAFGLCLLWTSVYFLKADRIASMFTDAGFHFTYAGFGWVRPMGQFGMTMLFWALSALAVCIAAGLFSRASALLFALGFGYAFLIDKTNYVNHNYLFVLLAFLLAWTPSGAALSLDALFRGARRKVPAWSHAVFKLQFAVVYVFAGLAKLNGDWLAGDVLDGTLRKEAFVTQQAWLASPALATSASWAAAAFDLAVVPLLFHKKLRWPALAAAVVFHALNDRLFTIGMFPWTMLAGTVCFFFGDVLVKLFRRAEAEVPAASLDRRRATAAALAAYAAVQIALPLRHFVYPGNVRWTDEGRTFAWRMMLDEKHAYARFFVHDPATGQDWEADGGKHLTARQALKVSEDPDMVRALARAIADAWAEDGFPGVEVRSEARLSLNGRPYFALVDPATDLAHARRGPFAKWITPFPDGRSRSAVDAAAPTGSTEDVLSER